MDGLVGVKGKRIAFLGNISHKKGPMLMLHAFQAVHEFDSEFTLHIGGNIQDPRFAVYFDHIIPAFGLQDSIVYYGYVDKVLEWLPQFDFLLVSSPLEGCPVGVLEGLSCGLTPLLYNFVGAKDLYPPDFIWGTFPELMEIIKQGPRDPEIFKKFVKENYSLDKQLSEISEIIDDLAKKPKKIPKKSTVSCVIAVKNGEKTIERTVNSLTKQTYKLDKIIVVDDGSTDETVILVDNCMIGTEIDYEIIINPTSKWVFSARNEGFKYVDSDYFFFLDADDWVDAKYVERMVQILDRNENISVAYPDMVYFDENNERVFLAPEFDPQILMQRNFIAYASMQHTSVFKELGGYSTYLNDCRNHLTEWDLWLQYVKMGKGFKRLPEPLFYYFKSDQNQMSSNYERPRQDMHLQMVGGLTDGAKDIQMATDKKRILLVCQGKDYCDRSKVGFELMTWVKSLEDFGDVFTFQYDVEMNHFGQDVMLDRLKDFLDLIKPDYVFHPSYTDSIPVSVWGELSEKYTTIVWHSDDDRRFFDFSDEYGKGFRYSITTYPEIYEKMAHPGKILSQWAVNQYCFCPKRKDIDVSFCGQEYGYRKELLDGLGVACYGNHWPNGFVDFKEMSSVLGRSRISISPAGGADGNKQIKLRTFEICASGALCLCEYVKGIEKYYEIGKEIVVFKTKDELAGLIDYYLNHSRERKEIARAGYERTLKEHLWKHRFEEIFKEQENENI